jgi:hypothetical protein
LQPRVCVYVKIYCPEIKTKLHIPQLTLNVSYSLPVVVCSP